MVNLDSVDYVDLLMNTVFRAFEIKLNICHPFWTHHACACMSAVALFE